MGYNTLFCTICTTKKSTKLSSKKGKTAFNKKRYIFIQGAEILNFSARGGSRTIFLAQRVLSLYV